MINSKLVQQQYKNLTSKYSVQSQKLNQAVKSSIRQSNISISSENQKLNSDQSCQWHQSVELKNNQDTTYPIQNTDLSDFNEIVDKKQEYQRVSTQNTTYKYTNNQQSNNIQRNTSSQQSIKGKRIEILNKQNEIQVNTSNLLNQHNDARNYTNYKVNYNDSKYQKKYNGESKKPINSRQSLILFKQGNQLQIHKDTGKINQESSGKHLHIQEENKKKELDTVLQSRQIMNNVANQGFNVYMDGGYQNTESNNLQKQILQQTIIVNSNEACLATSTKLQPNLPPLLITQTILTRPEYSTFQLNGQIKQRISSICNNIVQNDIPLIQFQFSLKRHQDIFLVHHLFNQTDFTKQDFLLAFDSQDMQNMRNVYGDDINIFKLEVVPNPQQLAQIQEIEHIIYTQMQQTSSNQEVLNFQSVVQNNGNIYLFLSLYVIQQYYQLMQDVLSRKQKSQYKQNKYSLDTLPDIQQQTTCNCSLIQTQEVSDCNEVQQNKKIDIQQNLDDQRALSNSLPNVLDVIRFIISILPCNFNITPEFIDIRQKSHQSIVQSRFWITQINKID